MSSESRKRIRAVVRGEVQGVGFRWFAERAAGEFGIAGWVRNLPDGSVELEAEGPSESLDRFTQKILMGPRSGRVENISIAPLPLEKDKAFVIRYH